MNLENMVSGHFKMGTFAAKDLYVWIAFLIIFPSLTLITLVEVYSIEHFAKGLDNTIEKSSIINKQDFNFKSLEPFPLEEKVTKKILNGLGVKRYRYQDKLIVISAVHDFKSAKIDKAISVFRSKGDTPVYYISVNGSLYDKSEFKSEIPKLKLNVLKTFLQFFGFCLIPVVFILYRQKNSIKFSEDRKKYFDETSDLLTL